MIEVKIKERDVFCNLFVVIQLILDNDIGYSCWILLLLRGSTSWGILISDWNTNKQWQTSIKWEAPDTRAGGGAPEMESRSSSQPVGSGFEPHWRPQPAKLPSFGGYSLETLPYLTYKVGVKVEVQP